MKSLLFGGTERQGTRTRRPARSSRTEQEEIPPLGLSSKNAFSAAPRIVSMSRGASAETKVETTTKPPELESMREKFCVKCGNLMGVEYQFCQVSVKDRHVLSVAIDCRRACLPTFLAARWVSLTLSQTPDYLCVDVCRPEMRERMRAPVTADARCV